MRDKHKIIFGFSAFVFLLIWAMRTKNEVVESIVFPLKVKLGLAKNNSSSNSSVSIMARIPADQNEVEAKKIFEQVKKKTPLGYVPYEKYVVGGHIFYGQFGDELQKLWRLGYDLSTTNKTDKGETPVLQKVSDAHSREMIELHKGFVIGFKNALEQLQQMLFSDEFPDMIGVSVIKFGLGDGFEISVLQGQDHTKTLAAFPERKYGGYPIQIRETNMFVAQ